MQDLEKTLDNLENSFVKFQEKYDKRFEQLCLQLEPSAPKPINTSEFQAFVKSGQMTQKSLTAGTEPGSYFVPYPVTQHIREHLDALNPLRQLCRVTSVNTDRLDLLLEDGQTETGWVNETEERKETQVKHLRQQIIQTHSMYARPRVTQQILDDSAIDLTKWMSQTIAEHMAISERYAFLYGDGKKQPQGLLTAPQASTASFDTMEKVEGPLSADLLCHMLSCLEGRYLPQAVWLMGRRSVAKIQGLKENGVMLWQPSLAQKMPATLLGYPVYVVDEMKDTLVFGNLHAAYTIVDRQGFSMLRDPYTHKPYVEFYATKRVGGALVDGRAVKVFCAKE